MSDCLADPAHILTLLCHTCRNHFEADERDGAYYDSAGEYTCDGCYCQRCTLGHLPDDECSADEPQPDLVELGDPDAAYDAWRDRDLALV